MTNQLKTEWVLGYYAYARHTYLQSTTLREFDKRRLINTTNKLDQAKTFPTKEEAEIFLSKCITNEKPYIAQEYRHDGTSTKPLLSEESDFSGMVLNPYKYGIYQYNGCYYIRKKQGPLDKDRPTRADGKGEDECVSNFIVVVSKADFKEIVLKSQYGPERVVMGPDMSSVARFRRMAAREGNYMFFGSEKDYSKLLDYLRDND